MTILEKTSQQGDSDDPPPKKKLKKSKIGVRSQAAPHVVNHPSVSSAPGPSHRRNEPRDIFSYLATSSSSRLLYVDPEPVAPQLFDTDHIIHKFQLDKFDVAIPPCARSSAPPAQSASSSHQVKTHIHNPDYLEYYIYGPWSRSPNAKAPHKPSNLKRPLPDVDLIEVLSSEDIVGKPAPPEPAPVSDGVSLLDDINNFDFDDKFGELEKTQQYAIWEDSKMHPAETPVDEAVSLLVPEMNGYDKLVVGGEGVRSTRSTPAAALSNLGNTCFLNSVLYTLRSAPNFLHNLHHLVNDMNQHSTNNIAAKGALFPLLHNLHHLVNDMNQHSTNNIAAKRTASLGRNLSLMSTKKKEKEVSSGAGDLTATVKTKKQIVTEKLHGVYEAMRALETKDHSDPFHPEVFLTALREVNPIFEGNQQQDAHELLVCLLDIFRETCQASARQAETRAAFEANAHSSALLGGGGDKTFPKKLTWLARTSTFLERKNKKNLAHSSAPRKLDRSDESISAIPSSGLTVEMPGESVLPLPLPMNRPEVSPQSYNNFVAQDFEGVMVLRTTCLECENTTEKNEPFADICVPIKTEYNDDNEEDMNQSGVVNPSELYQRAVVTDEFLRDRNKYYCEECQRYNEARRSVSYQRLPRLLTLQLKRFSSTYGAMSKVTKYMPTPMTLACFCEDCIGRKDSGGARHGYELYGVIMHLGPNMAGGHYIAYVRMTDSAPAYTLCTRDHVPGQSDPVKPIFKLFKQNATGTGAAPVPPQMPTCRALDCCAARLPCSDVHIGKYEPESPWMACDDDIVKVLTGAEVETLLSKNSTSNATPYLLFYARRTD